MHTRHRDISLDPRFNGLKNCSRCKFECQRADANTQYIDAGIFMVSFTDEIALPANCHFSSSQAQRDFFLLGWGSLDDAEAAKKKHVGTNILSCSECVSAEEVFLENGIFPVLEVRLQVSNHPAQDRLFREAV